MTCTAFGLCVPELLLPNPDIDLSRWATIACDQHTSSREYWDDVEKTIGESPSTYRIVYPEIDLGVPDEPERIAAIQRTMLSYLSDGTLCDIGPGFVLIERTLSDGRRRLGLIAALDLESYDFSPDSRSLVRPTEGTILERIPPRIRIREGAALESPHIMVLLDDPHNQLIEPLYAHKERLPLLYDTGLMLGGGHIRGYHIKDDTSLNGIADALHTLFAEKSEKDAHPLLFAVGDGNHSLATAKTHWGNVKKTLPANSDHPARYALVEIQNIHDPGIHFEPIHRALFSVDPGAFKSDMIAYFERENCTVQAEPIDPSRLDERIAPDGGTHRAGLLYRDRCEIARISPGLHYLPVGTMQRFLDQYLNDHPQSRIDYIHGKDTLVELSRKPETVGVYLPPVSKDSFFDTIVAEGVMPRKTFSMGEADEKRYYLECRRIG